MVTKKSSELSKKEETKKNSSKCVTTQKKAYKNSRKELIENFDIDQLKKTLKQTFVSNYIDIDSIPNDVLGNHFVDFALQYDGSDFKNDDEQG